MFLTWAEFDEGPEALEEGVRHITEEVVPAIQGAEGLIAGYWAGSMRSRMRAGILVAFLIVSAGYLGLAAAPNFALACAAIVFAHAGASTLWVFSTTLLQLQTDDRFRGRVFSAEFAFSVLTMSLSSYSAGALVDHGVPVSHVASLTGLIVLLPALLWAFVLRSATSRSQGGVR